MKYKNKFSEIEAIQFKGYNLNEIESFIKQYERIQLCPETSSFNSRIIIYYSTQNKVILDVDDFLIKNKNNKFDSLTLFDFESNYEKL